MFVLMQNSLNNLNQVRLQFKEKKYVSLLTADTNRLRTSSMLIYPCKGNRHQYINMQTQEKQHNNNSLDSLQICCATLQQFEKPNIYSHG